MSFLNFCSILQVNQLKTHVIFQDLIEKLSKNELPKNDYPCMNDPSPTFHGRSQSESAPPPAHSMRSRRTATWARPRDSEDGYSRCVMFVVVLSKLVVS